ncbi:MAG: response regulator [Candidatus Omnitrophica bacterium]|nr:response regulator [Candidatus Omnitrophota bacterium]
MKKILLLEDQAGMGELISDFMGRRGYKVDVTSTLEEAEKAFGPEYEFVLLDIMLEKGTSFPLLEKIKREHPSMPVYMFSGYDDQDFMDEAERLGADGFIPKTMGLDYLIDFFLSKTGPPQEEEEKEL